MERPEAFYDRSNWRAWALLLGIALLVTALAWRGIYVPGDVVAAQSVQSAHSLGVFGPLSEALYRFGLYPIYPVVGLVAGVLLALQGRPLAGAFLLLAMLARPLGTVIKEIVERPRPSSSFVSFVEGASGFSFPSGHVFGTVLLVGFLWFVLMEHETNRTERLLVSAVGVAFVALMGLQRVYAGAHWPSDVIAAYLWGGLVLFAIIQLYRTSQALFARAPRALL